MALLRETLLALSRDDQAELQDPVVLLKGCISQVQSSLSVNVAGPCGATAPDM